MTQRKSRSLSFVLISACILSIFACKTVGRNYMDNLEINYLTVRTFFEATPPDILIRMKDVQNITIPGPSGEIKARLYIPENADAYSPVLFYIHGGGFVMGSINHVDKYVRLLARETNMPAISIDYRLAPENPWPAALEDCKAAYLWTEINAENFFGGKNRNFIVAGESAGANLATSLTHWRKKEGLKQPVAQILYSPFVANPKSKKGSMLASREINAHISVITPDSIDFFNRAYTGNNKELYKEPYVFPVLQKSFSALPPAFITICQLDTLRDDATAYASLLRRDGVKVKTMYLIARDHAWIGSSVIKKTAKFIDGL